MSKIQFRHLSVVLGQTAMETCALLPKQPRSSNKAHVYSFHNEKNSRFKETSLIESIFDYSLGQIFISLKFLGTDFFSRLIRFAEIFFREPNLRRKEFSAKRISPNRIFRESDFPWNKFSANRIFHETNFRRKKNRCQFLKLATVCDKLRRLVSSCRYEVDVDLMVSQCVEKLCQTEDARQVCKFIASFRNECRNEIDQSTIIG